MLPTTSRSVIPVCDPEQEEFLGCHAAGNVMCFQSDEGDMKIPASVADSLGCHIPPKPGSYLSSCTVAGKTLLISYHFGLLRN